MVQIGNHLYWTFILTCVIPIAFNDKSIDYAMLNAPTIWWSAGFAIFTTNSNHETDALVNCTLPEVASPLT